MSSTSLTSLLGLSPSPTPHNHTPYYLILHFFFAYVFLSARLLKVLLKIDNNVSPRQDVATTGEAAVKSGKITRQQLNLVKRNEAAHANATEGYAVFAASMVLASCVGVEGEVCNWVGVMYTVARVGFAVAYMRVGESRGWSFVRTGFWWWGSGSCLWLFWQAGKRM